MRRGLENIYAAGMLLLHDCLGRWNGVYLRTAAGMTAQAEGRGREVLRRIKDRAEKKPCDLSVMGAPVNMPQLVNDGWDGGGRNPVSTHHEVRPFG